MTKFNGIKFNKIDSNEKAYFLGITWSDGYITGDGVFGIFTQDKEIIDKFKAFLDSSNKTTERIGYNNQPHYEVAFHSRKLQKKMQTYGLCRERFYKIGAPKINKKYTVPFLLGLFDGKSFINDSVMTYCFGSPFLKRYLQSFLNKNKIEHNIKIKTTYKNRKKYYELRVGGIFCKRLLDILYLSPRCKDLPILTRKKEIYDNYWKNSDRERKIKVNFQNWEKTIVKRIKNNKKCAERINNHSKNIGWTRTEKSIEMLRYKINKAANV